MHEIYSDDYASAAGGRSGGLIPEAVRRAAGAAVFVGLIALMGVWAYRLGTRDAADVPIIRAMEGPARIQPEEPGGRQAAHQGLEVNSVLSGQPAPVPRAAPVTEQLVAEALLAEEDVPQGELELRAIPPQIVTADDAGSTDLQTPVGEEISGEDISGEPAAGAAFIEPAPDLRAAGDGDASETPGDELANEAVVADGNATPATGPRPRSRPSGRAVSRAAAPSAEPAATANAVRSDGAGAPPASAAQEVASLSSGTRLVQLGAFDNAAVTREAWENLVVRHGDLLGGKSLFVERTTSNARVFYRLRVAGFANTDETRAMCEALRARGVDCIPVTLQ